MSRMKGKNTWLMWDSYQKRNLLDPQGQSAPGPGNGIMKGAYIPAYTY